MNNKKIITFLFVAVIFAIMFIPATVFAAGETLEISSADDLSNAIQEQEPNQTWNIKEGEYVLTERDLAKYSDWENPGSSIQGNWYFPIHENGITVVGQGNVVITSNVETKNGAWATQDFISVWGDDVTIQNVDIKCKKDQNKAIEIMGKNFTLKDCTLQKVNVEGSGSIYFNSQKNGDIGNATIENVTLYSWVTAANSANKSGKLTTKDVTIDFTDNFYAGYHEDASGYAWRPLIVGAEGVNINNSDFKLLVDDKINLTEQVFMEKLPENTTVVLTKDVSVDKMLNITKDNVTLNLGGNTLTASNSFVSNWDNKNDSHVLQVLNAKNVTIKNGSVVTTEKNKHGINIFDSEDVILEDLAVDNTKTIGGAPIVINNSSATVKGDLDLILGDNSWYGINVDPNNGKASLNFSDGSTVTMNGSKNLPAIFIDEEDREGNNITIVGAEAAGLTTDENGNFIVTEEPAEENNNSKAPDTQEKDTTPKTGAVVDIALVATLVAMVSLTGVVTVKKYNK